MTTTPTPPRPVPHPAAYSHAVIEEFRSLISNYNLTDKLVLDPFAGLGQRIDDLPVTAVKVELQWAWACQASSRMVQGNSCQLPFRDEVFAGVLCSPAYGNRMADKHNAQDRCRACAGTGMVNAGEGDGDGEEVCSKCAGAGRRKYKRITYKHMLEEAGEVLHPDNTGGAQWIQPAYRDLHVAAWTEVTRVCRPGAIFLLNVSDHIRDKKVANVSQWHMMTLHRIGWRMREFARVKTPRMGYGANHKARLYYENIFVMEKK